MGSLILTYGNLGIIGDIWLCLTKGMYSYMYISNGNSVGKKMS
jgi:hypothetical protein